MNCAKTIIILKNREEIKNRLINLIGQVSNDTIEVNGVFNIGLSGGSLVALLTESLRYIQTDYSKWRFFFCDERVVPENNPDSTFGQYKKLIDNLKLHANQFITIKQGVSAKEAAADYTNQISQHFSSVPCPTFDMLLLGLGPDGHTCSLFPGHKALDEKSKWIVSIEDSPKPPPCRITMTLPVINNALYCVFTVCGEDKAEVVKRILIEQEDLPATRVNPLNGKLFWILDEKAGKYQL